MENIEVTVRRRLQASAMAGVAAVSLKFARPAHALSILPTFDSSITGAANASAIETAIDSAANTIDALFSNASTVPILFEAVNEPNGFLAASESTYDTYSYANYASLLRSAAAAEPGNTVLRTAAANLKSGNQGGSKGIVATNTVFQALGLSGSALSGAYPSEDGGAPFDGIVLINLGEPLSFSGQPSANQYDATRAIEHEIDEVLGGGGSGTTLNDIAYYGKNNPRDAFTYYEGALDLYRYAGSPGAGKHAASFSTSSSALAYFSVDGGKTSIVGFNQYWQGDLSDFGPTSYACAGGGYGGPPGLIQDAFSCPGQATEAFTTSSPEYEMLEALGYDPAATTPGSGAPPAGAGASQPLAQFGGFDGVSGALVPEPSTWAMLLAGFATMVLGRKRWRLEPSRRDAG